MWAAICRAGVREEQSIQTKMHFCAAYILGWNGGNVFINETHFNMHSPVAFSHFISSLLIEHTWRHDLVFPFLCLLFGEVNFTKTKGITGSDVVRYRVILSMAKRSILWTLFDGCKCHKGICCSRFMAEAKRHAFQQKMFVSTSHKIIENSAQV